MKKDGKRMENGWKRMKQHEQLEKDENDEDVEDVEDVEDSDGDGEYDQQWEAEEVGADIIVILF